MAGSLVLDAYVYYQAYCRQLTSALTIAHKKGVCHGGLRPSAVLTTIPDKGNYWYM